MTTTAHPDRVGDLHMGRRDRRALRLRTAGIGVVAGAIAVVGLCHALANTSSELPVYVLGARRMLEGASPYVPGDLKPFTYPPFFGLVFVPIAWLSNDRVQCVLWYLVNATMLFVAVRVVIRWARQLALSPHDRCLFGVLVILLCARHVVAVFNTESHDMVLAGVLVMGALAWHRGRAAAAGAWAGLGAALKATPLLFVVLFLARRNLRAVAAMIAAATALTFAGEVLPGDSGQFRIVEWWATMVAPLSPVGCAELTGVWEGNLYFNQSLTSTLGRLWSGSVNHGWSRASTVGLQGAVLVLIWLTVRAAARAAGDKARVAPWIEWGAVINGMLLLSPVTSKWHFVYWIVPASAVAASALLGALGRRRFLWVGMLIAMSALTTKGVWGRDLGIRLADAGALTWSAVLMAVLLFSAARAISSPAPSTPGSAECSNGPHPQPVSSHGEA